MIEEKETNEFDICESKTNKMFGWAARSKWTHKQTNRRRQCGSLQWCVCVFDATWPIEKPFTTDRHSFAAYAECQCMNTDEVIVLVMNGQRIYVHREGTASSGLPNIRKCLQNTFICLAIRYDWLERKNRLANKDYDQKITTSPYHLININSQFGWFTFLISIKFRKPYSPAQLFSNQ